MRCMSCVGTCAGCGFYAGAILTTAARCSKALPALAGVVAAVGAADVYQKAALFFESSGPGGGEKPEPEKEPSGARRQNTEAEAKKYIKDLKDMGALGNRLMTKDGREAFKVTRDCLCRGRQFRKNEFISEDRFHNEVEYFQNEETALEWGTSPLAG